MGFFDKIKKAAAAAEAEAQAKKKAEETLNSNEKAVTISTGDIHGRYNVVDAIFAFDSHGTELFATADPATAFTGLKRKLRLHALTIGADAVINCQFEYRVAVGKGTFGGSKQCVELFAYGTAVKLAAAEQEGDTSSPAPAGQPLSALAGPAATSAQASQAYERAAECAKAGNKQEALRLLRSIIDLYPGTRAAEKAARAIDRR